MVETVGGAVVHDRWFLVGCNTYAPFAHNPPTVPFFQVKTSKCFLSFMTEKSKMKF